MLYTLCHKDIQVLSFEIENNQISNINEIFNKEHIPVGLFTEEKNDSKIDELNKWWKTRAIPASRQNLEHALQLLGNTTTEQLITQSFGLSLSDHYWAKPQDLNLNWSEINFFQNEFSEDVGKALFGTLNKDSKSISILSPDNTSDGWLKKKWIINNSERVLIKGGSGESQQEPFNEALASEICKRLNIPHVDYSILIQDYDYYSTCKAFTSLDSEFVPALRIYNLKKYSGGLWDKYSHFKETCEVAGIAFNSIKKQLCSMFILDYIIANEDRHFGNFGFLRNPDTLEWIGLAPVFDSGSSLFYKFPVTFLSDKEKTKSEALTARPFGIKHSDQIKLLPCAQLCQDLPLDNLNDISDWYGNLLNKNKRIDSNRRDLLCKLLQNRVIEMKKVLYEK